LAGHQWWRHHRGYQAGGDIEQRGLAVPDRPTNALATSIETFDGWRSLPS
jgi:hypothetical protein